MTTYRRIRHILTLALALFGCLWLLSGCLLTGRASNAQSPSPTPTPQASSHTIAVSWTQSPSTNLQGSRVYRSQVSGGPYANTSGILGQDSRQSTDSNACARSKSFYVVTRV